MESDAETDYGCQCNDCPPSFDDSSENDNAELPEADKFLPPKDSSEKLSLVALACWRLRRPDIPDTELMVPGGPQKGSFMARLTEKMPVETLTEILGWLHPIDLIYLACMTKDMRNLLASNSSPWRTARNRLTIALPDCPPCTTEEQWALFLFTDGCMFCGGCPEFTAWSLRVRICVWCFPTYLCASNFVKRFNVDRRWAFVSRQLTPFWYGSETYRLKYDVVKVTRDISDLDLNEDKTALYDFWETRKEEVAILADLDYFGDRDYKELEGWGLRNAFEKEYIAYAAAELTADGYEMADIKASLSLRKFPSSEVWQIPKYRDLDSYEWRRIRPTVVKMVEANRKKRLEAQRREEIATLVKELRREWVQNEPGLVPPVEEILGWPLVSAILLSDDPLSPSPSVALELAKPKLGVELKDWRSQQEASTRSRMPPPAKARFKNVVSGRQYKCALCPSGPGTKGATRLFDFSGLKNHISAKHGINRKDVNAVHWVLWTIKSEAEQVTELRPQIACSFALKSSRKLAIFTPK